MWLMRKLKEKNLQLMNYTIKVTYTHILLFKLINRSESEIEMLLSRYKWNLVIGTVYFCFYRRVSDGGGGHYCGDHSDRDWDRVQTTSRFEGQGARVGQERCRPLEGKHWGRSPSEATKHEHVLYTLVCLLGEEGRGITQELQILYKIKEICIKLLNW